MSINTAIPKKISRVVPFPGAAAAAEVSGAHNTEANMIVENENDETVRQFSSGYFGDRLHCIFTSIEILE